MTRVLIVEDSSTAMILLRNILLSHPSIEIAGEATTGFQAVSMAEQLHPDLILMDIVLPELDGLSATKKIMATNPTPIVIISGYTDKVQGVNAIHALSLGAAAIMKKPHGPNSPDFENECKQLIATVVSMAKVRVVHNYRYTKVSAPPKKIDRIKNISVIAIAASVGGPQALHVILSKLPSNFPIPIILAQHIASGFSNAFVAWLNSITVLEVRSATEKETIRGGTVYVAPEDKHILVNSESTISLSDAPPLKGLRPSADILFESVAKIFGKTSIAIILTGMGQDGVNGLAKIKKAGGKIIAQDEQSSIVFGMPRAAIEAGLADTVLSINDIAGYLQDLTRNGTT